MKNKDQLFFSILMPAYHENSITIKSIKSILIQNYHSFELIICNDNPSNQLKKAIIEINDPRIIYKDNRSRLGLALNFNKCLSLAKGKYIFLMADDDLMFQNCLSITYRKLRAGNNIGVARCNFIRFRDETGKIFYWPKEKKDILLSKGIEALQDFLFLKVGFSSGNIIIRKGLTNGFGTGLQTCFLEPMIPILSHHNFLFITHKLIANRTHLSAGYRMYKKGIMLHKEMFALISLIKNNKVKKRTLLRYFISSSHEFMNISLIGGKRVLIQNIRFIIGKCQQVLVNPRFEFFALFSLFSPNILLSVLRNFLLRHAEHKLSMISEVINYQKELNLINN